VSGQLINIINVPEYMKAYWMVQIFTGMGQKVKAKNEINKNVAKTRDNQIMVAIFR
jgi:hypothetical protein